MQKCLSVGEAFAIAKINWSKNWGYWFLFAVAIPFGLMFFDPSNWLALSELFIDYEASESLQAASMMLGLVTFPISLAVGVATTILSGYGGIIYMLRSARGEQISSWKELLPPSLKKGLLFYLVSLAMGLCIAVLVGLAAAPGGIAALVVGMESEWLIACLFFAASCALITLVAILLRYWPLMLLYVDKGISMNQAFELAPKVTAGSYNAYVLLGLAALVLQIAGFLAFFVGLLVAIPVTVVMTGAFYQRLVDATPEAAELKSVIK